MLGPRDTPTRERKSLDGLWRFALDADGRGRQEGWWRQPLAGAREIPVPASYNDIFADAEVRDHVGDVWYQTAARVPERWRGERIVLRFDAATHRAVVWVDETQVAEHEGGYTPFEADVTDARRAGRRDPDHGRRRQRPHAGTRSRPATWRRRRTAARQQRTSTTSSTTPACTGRSGSTRRPRSYVERRDRRHRASTARPAPSATTSRPAAATPRGARDAARRRRRRGRARDRRLGRAHGRGRPAVAAGRGLPVRPDRRALRRGGRARRHVLAAGRHPDRRGSTARAS